MFDENIHREIIAAGDLKFEVLCAGDPESSRLALCLHGFPEHAHSWRLQMPLLARLGYRVWAPNQRGYGNTRPRPKNKAYYHRDRLLEDVAALIDASGANEVTLIGHDWGGALAWLFALRAVRPLERLVVMNLPHPARFYEHLLNDRAQQKRSRYERLFQIPWLPDWLLSRNHASAIGRMFSEGLTRSGAMADADVRVFRENAAARGAMTAMLNWYRANPFREAFAGEFAVLETPTLMIWGVNDIALGQEMTIGTDEIVRDFTLRYLDASHSVQQDAPDETNAILEAWLTGRAVPEFLVPNSDAAR